MAEKDSPADDSTKNESAPSSRAGGGATGRESDFLDESRFAAMRRNRSAPRLLAWIAVVVILLFILARLIPALL